MISLSDRQLHVVQQAAAAVPYKKRGIFLQRLSAMLELRRRFSDDDVDDCAALARQGLVQRESSAA
jgi:hypothetical protein